MQVQRTFLDQLRINDPFDHTDQIVSYFLHLKQEITYCELVNNHNDSDSELRNMYELTRQIKKLAGTNNSLSNEEINTIIGELISRIDKINSLTNGFIEEMRLNAYNLPKGGIRNAYAVDCCNIIDSCRNAQMLLLQESSHIDEKNLELRRIDTILNSLSRRFRIGHIFDPFEEYYPNTQTFERNSIENSFLPDQESEEQLSINREYSEKLIWTCKPAIAGYIISELLRAGYIEPPKTNGELSLNKLANICHQIFDTSGFSPTLNSWRNVIDPTRNTLPEIKRQKLSLPDLDQLT